MRLFKAAILAGTVAVMTATAAFADDVKIGFIVKQPEEPWFQDEWKFAQEAAKAGELAKTWNVDAATNVGKLIAQRAVEKGVKQVVFDRGGYLYHGRVKALAEAAREGGLEF